MKRDDFKKLVKKHGKDAKKAILDWLSSPEGREAVEKGPVWHRNRPPEELADLLLMDKDLHEGD